MRQTTRLRPTSMPLWVLVGVASGCVVAAVAGCRVENAPTRAQVKESRQEKRDDALTTPRSAPPEKADEAVAVVQACGPAERDEILPIYDKMDNGPVRRMFYKGMKPVMLEFVPTISEAQRVERQALFAKGRPALKAELPAHAVWEFSVAHMEQEEILSSARLQVYLPCAAKALGNKD